ncbi:DUF3606 domain-containing protein [Phenylobacterium sp. VNQ135]|uniref:DUF3606 domain-containing protein n=1 Tax=Phenylobacterium sp. VNQ135 TaxID=3400922 RepID=UPI003C0D670E
MAELDHSRRLSSDPRRNDIADSKTDVGEPDRSRVSGAEAYEVRDFAGAHGITPDQARELIRPHGDDRDARDRAAQRLKSN